MLHTHRCRYFRHFRHYTNTYITVRVFFFLLFALLWNTFLANFCHSLQLQKRHLEICTTQFVVVNSSITPKLEERIRTHRAIIHENLTNLFICTLLRKSTYSHTTFKRINKLKFIAVAIIQRVSTTFRMFL